MLARLGVLGPAVNSDDLACHRCALIIGPARGIPPPRGRSGHGRRAARPSGASRLKRNTQKWTICTPRPKKRRIHQMRRLGVPAVPSHIGISYFRRGR
jgi:hypothetical protein